MGNWEPGGVRRLLQAAGWDGRNVKLLHFVPYFWSPRFYELTALLFSTTRNSQWRHWEGPWLQADHGGHPGRGQLFLVPDLPHQRQGHQQLHHRQGVRHGDHRRKEIQGFRVSPSTVYFIWIVQLRTRDIGKELLMRPSSVILTFVFSGYRAHGGRQADHGLPQLPTHHWDQWRQAHRGKDTRSISLNTPQGSSVINLIFLLPGDKCLQMRNPTNPPCLAS